MLPLLQGLPVGAEHDHSHIVTEVLNMHSLGEHVSPHWRVMRWIPPRPRGPILDGKAAGPVEKVVGGCYVNLPVSYLVLSPRWCWG